MAPAVSSSSPDLLVIGAGIIGLASAWTVARAGAEVTVVDPDPGSGASFAAAGMIAPVSEAHFGEEALLQLNLRSARAWPAFADELEAATGAEIGYRRHGTLAVGFDAGDRAVLDELWKFQNGLGLDSTRVGPSGCRQIEPLLAAGLRGGLLVPGDHQVDPRRVTTALVEACRREGVAMVTEAASEVRLGRGGGVEGANLSGGARVVARRTLLAAGWRTSALPGLPAAALPPVRPVKGQILRLRLPDGFPSPSTTLRAVVQGHSVYLVTRADGEIVVGATVEELGADTRVTAGGVYELLRDAQAVLPCITEAEVVETMAGLRPGSPDNAPLVGPGALEGLLIATGHFRHGILLAPVTAALVTGLVASEDAELPAWAQTVDPRRFSVSSVPT